MRSTVACLLASSLAAQPDAGPATETALRVVTFNIRYGTAPDGEHAWPHRRDLVRDVLAHLDPHLLGVQEALAFQLGDIAGSLPHHRVLGEGRRGGDRDEYSALLVDGRRLAIEDHGQFWLSATPDVVGSVGFDAALPRVCTWAVLVDRVSGARFQVLNTHLDHRGAVARRESAALMVAHAAKRALPAVVMGDLNDGPEAPPVATLRAAGFEDALRLRNPGAPPQGTFTNFREVIGNRQIDYIFVRGGVVATAADVVAWQRDGRFPSDHLPVSAELWVPAEPSRALVPSLGEESFVSAAELEQWRLPARPGPAAPAAASEAMCLAIGDRTYCYFVGGGEAPRIQACVSLDAGSWSAPVDVCFGGRVGAGPGSAAAPFVLRRGGMFFLLRTAPSEVEGLGRVTFVYRSADPLDFGRDDDRCLVTVLPVAGAEIVRRGDEDFITCGRDADRGVRLRRVDWRE